MAKYWTTATAQAVLAAGTVTGTARPAEPDRIQNDGNANTPTTSGFNYFTANFTSDVASVGNIAVIQSAPEAIGPWTTQAQVVLAGATPAQLSVVVSDNWYRTVFINGATPVAYTVKEAFTTA